MKRATPLVVAALGLITIATEGALLAPAGHAAAAFPEGAIPSQAETPAEQLARPLPPAARPMPGTAPAVAAGQVDVVAWLQDSGGGRRVVGLTGGAPDAVVLGPAGAGSDGAPAAAATAGGAVWIVAARHAAGTQRLWAQRWADGAWQPPIGGPAARPYDHHPSLAGVPGTDQLWAAWLGEDASGADGAMVYASRWTGSGWSAAEPLPRTPGSPMAPSIAVDRAGAAAVAWAAGDGADAEIWISRREAGRWSTPRPLSRNLVPDITPSLIAAPRGLLATWISYTDDGYLPTVAIARPDGTWSDPQPLDDTPGSRPRAVVLDGTPAVLWRRLEAEPAAGTIAASLADGAGWSVPRAIAPGASGSPFGIATAGRRLLLAFSRPDGRLAVASAGAGADGRPAAAPEMIAALAADALIADASPGAAIEPVPAPAADGDLPSNVPAAYTAFGDSITNGVIYDPDRRDSVGYRQPLQQLLRAFFGLGTVFNAGVDGESTSDGVGRIDNAIRAQQADAILIMEGTNDLLDVVDIDVIAFNLRRMVQRSYEENPDILPFLAQIPPRFGPGPDGFDGPGNGRIDELNELLPEIAEEEGAVVVDMNTPLDGHPELMSNHVHPSEAGYQVMAEVWYETIRPAALDRTNRGDVDGSGRTDGFDLIRLALAFGAVAGEPRYTGAADINGDGIVDGFDLDLLVEFFGRDLTGDEDGGGS
jgi:lysophospholipase L1-like esterase